LNLMGLPISRVSPLLLHQDSMIRFIDGGRDSLSRLQFVNSKTAMKHRKNDLKLSSKNLAALLFLIFISINIS
jgi:hypothetical protein